MGLIFGHLEQWRSNGQIDRKSGLVKVIAEVVDGSLDRSRALHYDQIYRINGKVSLYMGVSDHLPDGSLGVWEANAIQDFKEPERPGLYCDHRITNKRESTPSVPYEVFNIQRSSQDGDSIREVLEAGVPTDQVISGPLLLKFNDGVTIKVNGAAVDVRALKVSKEALIQGFDVIDNSQLDTIQIDIDGKSRLFTKELNPQFTITGRISFLTRKERYAKTLFALQKWLRDVHPDIELTRNQIQTLSRIASENIKIDNLVLYSSLAELYEAVWRVEQTDAEIVDIMSTILNLEPFRTSVSSRVDSLLQEKWDQHLSQKKREIQQLDDSRLVIEQNKIKVEEKLKALKQQSADLETNVETACKLKQQIEDETIKLAMDKLRSIPDLLSQIAILKPLLAQGIAPVEQGGCPGGQPETLAKSVQYRTFPYEGSSKKACATHQDVQAIIVRNVTRQGFNQKHVSEIVRWTMAISLAGLVPTLVGEGARFLAKALSIAQGSGGYMSALASDIDWNCIDQDCKDSALLIENSELADCQKSLLPWLRNRQMAKMAIPNRLIHIQSETGFEVVPSAVWHYAVPIDLSLLEPAASGNQGQFIQAEFENVLNMGVKVERVEARSGELIEETLAGIPYARAFYSKYQIAMLKSAASVYKVLSGANDIELVESVCRFCILGIEKAAGRYERLLQEARIEINGQTIDFARLIAD